MKLRTCSNFHFIRAIKDGLVIKIHNVDSRGRPGLTFKKLEDILGLADSEFPCWSLVDRNTRERATVSTEFCSNGVDDENDCDSDELFGEVTLQQLKKKCKTKKRKAAEPVFLTPKQEPCDLEPEDDDSDLKQPLSSWKSKLSKSPKSTKKRAKKSLTASYENARSLKYERITDSEDALQSSDDLCAQITVKVECQETVYSDCQNMTSVIDAPICNQQMGFCGVESGKSFEIVKGREPICGVGEVSHDHLEHSEPIIYLPWNGVENMEVGHQELVGQQSPVLHVSELKNEGDVNNVPLSLSSVETVSPDKNQSPSACNSSQNCPYVQQYVQQVNNIEVSDATIGEVSHDHLEHSEPIIYLLRNGGENMEVGHQEMVGQQSPVLHVSELKNEGVVNNVPLSLSSVVTVSPDKNQSPSACNSSQSCPYVQLYVQQVNNIRVEVSDATIGEVSHDHLEHSEPIIYLPQNGGENMEVGHQEMVGQQSHVLHVSELKNEGDVNNVPLSLSSVVTVSPDKNQSPSACNSSQSCPYVQQYVQQVSNNIGVEVSDATGLCSMELGHVGHSCISEDDDVELLPPYQENGSLSAPINNFCSTWISRSCLGPEKEIVTVEDDSSNIMEKPLVTSTSGVTAIDYLDSNNSLALLEDASPMHEKQPSVLVTVEHERDVYSNSDPHDTVNEHSSSEMKNYHCSELQQTPERFPSTRKIISPTSQEKLCLAMNSSGSFDNIDLYKCKEKLFFGKQAVDKASLTGSDIKGGIATSSHPKGPEKVIRTKFTLSPKQILKKPKNDKKSSPPRKDSPPKGCLEGPRLCRSLPRLSTGCTSIQACSESAIAFSQRQMHDIESLALKLMNELKSMKDIVEEKLFYESYRSTSLKTEADEVKVAIKTATKTEETARKWLSMMARDCTRFCKIMRLTENDGPATENAIQDNTPQRERKKISFADEAGGVLCDVKFFEDCVAFQESRSETVATS